jgi:serine protease Do
LQVVVARLADEALARDDSDSPEASGDDGSNSSRLGVSLEPLNGDSRNRYRIDNSVNGVLVVDVDIDGPARDKLNPGDVIEQVAQAPVRSVEEVEERIDGEIAAGRSAVLLRVIRNGEQRYVGIRVADR